MEVSSQYITSTRDNKRIFDNTNLRHPANFYGLYNENFKSYGYYIDQVKISSS